MGQNTCEHKYPDNSWKLDEFGAAVRTCEKCGYRQQFENGEDFVSQIEKQIEASNFLDKFRQFDKNNQNIIQYLWLLLDDYYMYLDEKGINLLLQKMDEIKHSEVIDEKNIIYINYLSTYIKEKNFKVFWDIFEEFEQANLQNFMSKNEQFGFHR